MSEFLTLAEVLAIHQDQIDRYGGSDGVRDAGQLESALILADPSLVMRWPKTQWRIALMAAFIPRPSITICARRGHRNEPRVERCSL
jgi:prophage maintenance system killer protein